MINLKRVQQRCFMKYTYRSIGSCHYCFTYKDKFISVLQYKKYIIIFLNWLAARVIKTRRSWLNFLEITTELRRPWCFEGWLWCVANNNVKYKIHEYIKTNGGLTKELHNAKTHRQRICVNSDWKAWNTLGNTCKHTLHECPCLLGWTYSRAVKFNLFSTSKSGPVSLKKKSQSIKK